MSGTIRGKLAGACCDTQPTQHRYAPFNRRLSRVSGVGAECVSVCVVDWTLCAPRARSLQLQPRREGNTGERCLDVPGAMRGVLGEQPSTALQGEKTSLYRWAPAHADSCALAVLSYCKLAKRDLPHHSCAAGAEVCTQITSQNRVFIRCLKMKQLFLFFWRFFLIEVSWPCLYVNTQTWKFHVSAHTVPPCCTCYSSSTKTLQILPKKTCGARVLKCDTRQAYSLLDTRTNSATLKTPDLMKLSSK